MCDHAILLWDLNLMNSLFAAASKLASSLTMTMVMMKMTSLLILLSSSLPLVQSQHSQSHLLAKRDAAPLLNNLVGDLARPFLQLFGVGPGEEEEPLDSYQKPTYYHKPTYTQKPTYYKPTYTQKPTYKPTYTQKPTYKPTYHKPTYATTYYKPTYETYHYTPEYTTHTPVYHSSTTHYKILANLVVEPEEPSESEKLTEAPAIPPPFEQGKIHRNIGKNEKLNS